METLLSIIIPTRNRVRTTQFGISQALAVASSDDLEVIVHDCSDEDVLGPLLSNHEDKRLRYFHVEPVDMTSNWNLALEKVRGEYVIIIGDDDAILPETYTLCRWARENSLDALSHTKRILYNWPDHVSNSMASRLFIDPFDGKLEYHRGNTEFMRSLKTARCANFEVLPQLYHGIVKMDVLRDMKARTGRFLGGTCPDYYAAFSIAWMLGEKRYGVISFPFSYHAASRKSNATRSTVKEEMNKHLDEYVGYSWPPDLPDNGMYLLAFIAESLFRMLDAFGLIELLKKYNFADLYASCLLSKRITTDCKMLAGKYFSLTYHSRLYYLFRLVINILKEAAKRIVFKLELFRAPDPVYLLHKNARISTAPDIIEANAELRRYIESEKITCKLEEAQ